MKKENKTIIEINGVKLEVDLRTAKRVDQFKIGDRIKVLKKEYGDSYVVYHGIIIGFDNFKELPTIVITYLKASYGDAEIKFAYINANSKDIEITHADYEDLPVHKADVIEKFDKQIEKKQVELDDLKRQRSFFITHFEKAFGIE